MKDTKLYHLNKVFAQKQGLPVYFVGKPLTETKKAVYLYGHGTTETSKMGVCMECGAPLTHPVSVELGIGPICGSHHHDWDRIGGYTMENIERLKGAMVDIKIDSWVPKSVIKETLETDEIVSVPENHKMLQRRKKERKKVKKALPYKTSHGNWRVKISFPFDREVLKQVKTIPGRKFHDTNGEKYWSAPLSIDAAEKLDEFGFQLHPKLEEFLERSTIDMSALEPIDTIPGLQGELYPFQAKGVAFLEARNGRGLIGDEMGLGKTVQALAYLQLHPELRPAIIVVPASLKLNWKREAEAWMPNPKVEVVSGTKPYQTSGDIVVINYDILSDWVDQLDGLNAEVLITDECHYYKNNKAQRTKAVKKLGKNIDHVIALSGTPIVNRPKEIYNAINLVNPTIFPNFWEYAQRYCNAHHTGFGWNFKGASNTEELHEKLTSTVMVRRRKKDVLKDLPEKQRSIIPMEINNRREYAEAERDFVKWLRRNKGAEKADKASNAETLAEIEGLKQLTIEGKMSQAIAWIEDFLETDEKLVVFAVHRKVIDQLMEVFGDCAVKVDGSVKQEDRQEAVDQFQNNKDIRLFVGNIKAAGVGITLTAASNVVFLELGWSPGDMDQAEDRVHRIGQEADAITAYYLLAENTIEEKIAAIIDQKREILDQVLDGTFTEDESLLSKLLADYEY